MNCKNPKCKKETRNPKFCSRSCAATITNLKPKRKITRKCVNCDELVRNYRSTLCDDHYNIYLSQTKSKIEELTILDYMKANPGRRRAAIYSQIRVFCRNWNSHLIGTPCRNCKYDKHVELCHIKPISSFPYETKIKDINNISNIIQLCRNCHWELDHDFLKLEDIPKF